jgi:hypothetical protein
MIRQSASDDLLHDACESFGIRSLTVVIAECLLIQIPEQMERLNARQATFQERPEVFHRVGMHVVAYILDCVINDFVLGAGMWFLWGR